MKHANILLIILLGYFSYGYPMQPQTISTKQGGNFNQLPALIQNIELLIRQFNTLMEPQYPTEDSFEKAKNIISQLRRIDISTAEEFQKKYNKKQCDRFQLCTKFTAEFDTIMNESTLTESLTNRAIEIIQEVSTHLPELAHRFEEKLALKMTEPAPSGRSCCQTPSSTTHISTNCQPACSITPEQGATSNNLAATPISSVSDSHHYLAGFNAILALKTLSEESILAAFDLIEKIKQTHPHLEQPCQQALQAKIDQPTLACKPISLQQITSNESSKPARAPLIPLGSPSSTTQKPTTPSKEDTSITLSTTNVETNLRKTIDELYKQLQEKEHNTDRLIEEMLQKNAAEMQATQEINIRQAQALETLQRKYDEAQNNQQKTEQTLHALQTQYDRLHESHQKAEKAQIQLVQKAQQLGKEKQAAVKDKKTAEKKQTEQIKQILQKNEELESSNREIEQRNNELLLQLEQLKETTRQSKKALKQQKDEEIQRLKQELQSSQEQLKKAQQLKQPISTQPKQEKPSQPAKIDSPAPQTCDLSTIAPFDLYSALLEALARQIPTYADAPAEPLQTENGSPCWVINDTSNQLKIYLFGLKNNLHSTTLNLPLSYEQPIQDWFTNTNNALIENKAFNERAGKKFAFAHPQDLLKKVQIHRFNKSVDRLIEQCAIQLSYNSHGRTDIKLQMPCVIHYLNSNKIEKAQIVYLIDGFTRTCYHRNIEPLLIDNFLKNNNLSSLEYIAYLLRPDKISTLKPLCQI